MRPSDWCLDVGPAAQAELSALARRLAGYEGSIEDLVPGDFELPAVGRLMAEAKARLDHGLGFAILDRLPIEGLDERTAKALAWLVVAHLGPIVHQKFKGRRLYEVRDTGTAMGHGVRRSITNLDQEFHTDGGWLAAPPEIIALACIRQAKSGGMSQVASLLGGLEEMRTRHPELLGHLFEPLWWDRQAEHAAEDSPCSRNPIVAWDGTHMIVRYYDDYVRQGHKLMAEPIPERTRAALDAFRAILETPGRAIEVRLEPGQIEIVNNHLLAHARTAFQDSDPERGRLLLRLWMRRDGGTEFEPAAATAP